MCPFHVGKNGPKLGISIGTGFWKCWVCPNRGRSIVSLFSKINAPESKITLAREVFREKQFVSTPIQNSLNLPTEYIPLWQPTSSFFYNKAKEYITSRGVTESDIVKHRLGYCDHGRYSDMVIMPSFNEDGQLVFFSGRSFLPNARHKFSIPNDISKDVICDENLINWDEPIILVESKLDSIIVRRNSIPLNGKQIPTTLKQKIILNAKTLIFCLDGDALKDAMRLSGYFIKHGIDVYKVTLPESEDPSSLGHLKVWEYIDNATKITEFDLFSFNLIDKLK